MTESEKMLNGEWYDTSDPWLVSQRNTARDVSLKETELYLLPAIICMEGEHFGERDWQGL